MTIKSTLFQGIVALTLLAASNVTHAAFFDLFLTVTGGTSKDTNGTPGNFSGSF